MEKPKVNTFLLNPRSVPVSRGCLGPVTHSCVLRGASAPHEMHDQGNDGHNEQQVNQPARNVECEKAQGYPVSFPQCAAPNGTVFSRNRMPGGGGVGGFVERPFSRPLPRRCAGGLRQALKKAHAVAVVVFLEPFDLHGPTVSRFGERKKP